ncbi:hypothetical protein C0Q70_08226 [Pomacea canaliculata]|uniref:Uncharacterized protein n=1 Tax=Pomacea canaliculata TaxID=400727 RepID=A0A2T7PHB4_POMCA|nr:uncharacterized protein C22orf15-like [Pomacea canaliculata]PVD32780.1 hypothetical protein C0Q70_08226 [Pomacea canaliculata]
MAEQGTQSFIIVKYGDNEEAIFNPWCSTHTLLEWIRRKCKCDDSIVLDLVDLEGQIKNLSTGADDYACDYVTPRETYILIRVDKQGDNGPNRYVSLLNNLDQFSPDLMVKLNSLSRPSTRNKKSDRLKRNNNRQTPRPTKTAESTGKRPVSGERDRPRPRQGK